MSVLAGFAVEVRGRFEILPHAEPRLKCSSSREAAIDLSAFACLLEHVRGDGVVSGDTVARRVQPAEPKTSGGNVSVARSRQEIGGAGKFLPNALARGVQSAEPRTSGDVSAIARFLKQCGGPHRIFRDPSSAVVFEPEASAAVHPSAIASLLKEGERARRIAFDAPAAQIRESEAGAPVPDAADARSLEEVGGSLVVLEDVLPFLELDCQLVARGCISGVAGASQLLGLSVSGMTPGQCEAQE